MTNPDALRLPKDMIDGVSGMALSDRDLESALRRWHQWPDSLPTDWQGEPFHDWLDSLICHVATQIWATCDSARPIPDEKDVLDALRLQAIGDPFALDEAKTARKSFETDVNCYVEEGVVFSNIWLKGTDEKAVEAEADRIAQKMNAAGYSAEVWVDEEDAREATVNAQMDFPLYLGLVRRGKL